MRILIYIILILWLAKAARDVLFWVYLWQLKEYRLDRVRAHFELKSSKEIFLSKIFFIKVLLLLSSPALLVGIWQFFFQIIVSILYLGLGIRSIYAAYIKTLKEPVYTKKAAFLGVIIVAVILFITLFAFVNFSYVAFLVSVLAMDILLPVIVAIIIGLSKFPSQLLKGRLIKKAKEKRKSLKDVLVIGITGSYGKTSVKEYLSHILSGKLKVLKTSKNTNTEIGIARTVLDDLSKKYDVFVVEMGAYREGEIKKICDIVMPQIGILTGIDEQHASLFGSLEKTIKAKYELIESLPKHGMAVFNGENDYTRKLYEETTHVPKRMYALRSFSVGEKPDITCEKVDFSRDGMRFYIRAGDDKVLLRTQVVGHQNALNIAGSVLVARELGMNLEAIKKRVADLPVPEHTTKILEGINGSTIIDDTYSSNPHGILSALDVLEHIKGNKKILVLYPLIELGQYARDVHRRLALKINKVCDLCILTSSDFEREIRRNAPNTDVLIIVNPEKVIEKLKKVMREGDVVLLENRIPEAIKKALIEAE